MVYDKNDAHKTIYDSYDLQLALKLIKNVVRLLCDYLKDSDEKIYIDLGRSKGYTDKIIKNDNDLHGKITLKTAAAKKMRPRVIGYSQSEYL